MQALALGQNMPIQTLPLDIIIHINMSQTIAVDVASYVLSAETQKVRGDDDMIFYGQTANQAKTVQLSQNSDTTKTFTVNLAGLEPSVGKIAFSATLENSNLQFSVIQSVVVTLSQQGTNIASFRIDGAGRTESALILGEVYRHQGNWKFRAIGQGFNGGLKPLAEFYGVDIADDPTPSNQSTSTNPTNTGSSSTASTNSAPSKVSLSKISLDKQQPKISLDKRADGGFGEIKINLNWNRGGNTSQPAKQGFFSKMLQGISNGKTDLDLGCLFELQSGDKGIVQALGNTFGHFQQAPFIQLSGDDRTGAVSEGEWLRVNGQHWQHIKRIVVYAFIYEGVPNWASTDAVVTIYIPNEPPIEIILNEGDNSKGLCAIVMLENIGGTIQVSREMNYFTSQQPLDRHYQWGLRWQAGSK